MQVPWNIVAISFTLSFIELGLKLKTPALAFFTTNASNKKSSMLIVLFLNPSLEVYITGSLYAEELQTRTVGDLKYPPGAGNTAVDLIIVPFANVWNTAKLMVKKKNKQIA